MPICIECRYPVNALYTEYSKADDRSLGKGVRLTQCPRCKRFADKYVEHDFVVLFIDLVLIKPQVCSEYPESGLKMWCSFLIWNFRSTDIYYLIGWDAPMANTMYAKSFLLPTFQSPKKKIRRY